MWREKVAQDGALREGRQENFRNVGRIPRECLGGWMR